MSSRRSGNDKSRRDRRELQKRMRRLKRKVKKDLRLPTAGQEPIIVISPPGHEKMSEVLEDFIEPYKDDAPTYEAMQKLLTVGVLAWNAALLPEDRQQAMIDDCLRKGMKGAPEELLKEARAIIKLMIARKQRDFPRNRRAILSFELIDTGEDFHLNVASTLEPTPEL